MKHLLKDPSYNALGINSPEIRRLRIEDKLTDPSQERRRYPRYDTEAKIFFQVTYDIQTIVRFQIVDREKRKKLSRKYEAVSKNVSVEGLCFTSEKELAIGESLWIEVFLPNQKEPIFMEGEVRWSTKIKDLPGKTAKFDAGIKILSVKDVFVPSSIYQDEDYQVTWSILLESVLGSFRIYQQKKKP